MRTKKTVLKRDISVLRKAIFSKCLDCVCCQPTLVIGCEISTCPLWQLRPKKLKGLYSLAKELRKSNIGFYEAEKM